MTPRQACPTRRRLAELSLGFATVGQPGAVSGPETGPRGGLNFGR